MAELVLKLFSAFCGFGGKYLFPFLFPLLNLIMPPNLICGWAILLLCFFTPIMVSGQNNVNILNASSDGKSRNGSKAFGFSFLLYYICMAILGYCIFSAACAVADNDYVQ